MADLAVGMSLANAVARLDSIMATLEPAYDAGIKAASMVSVESIYEGAARAELETFYQQYVSGVENLMNYYALAEQYLIAVEEEIEYLDAQLAQAAGE